MDPARAEALRATLDMPAAAAGAPLPPFFHQVYFWDARPPGALGRDGHPRIGGFIPDLGLPRRMWAGGRLVFAAPLFSGRVAEKVTTVENVVQKSGHSGPLAFVTLRHDIRQDGQICVTEWQDLVYREDPSPDAPKPTAPQAPEGAPDGEGHSFSPTLLFRYSALTFNGHRIHYDRAYCETVEGYGGLVVHGPLLAQLLMLKAERALGALKRFTFRATAPLLDTEPATLCRDGAKLWVRGPEGRLCLEAEAQA